MMAMTHSIASATAHSSEFLVRLAQVNSELICRSQAKLVMSRVTQFNTVLLDFEGVERVGHSFVDEVFRVFATAHPHIRLCTMGMSPDVARLVALFGNVPSD
jgi:anti-anti-sigma regulatory factor